MGEQQLPLPLPSQAQSERRLTPAQVECQWLANERTKYPTKGPGSKPWGDLLRNCGIPQQRASEAMRYAGYVEKVSPESGDTLPDLRAAGIDTKPRKGDSEDEGEDDPASSATTPADWDVQQMKVCERVKKFAMKLPDQKKSDLAFSLRQLADAIEEMPTWTK